jgi:hypothetical protein
MVGLDRLNQKATSEPEATPTPPAKMGSWGKWVLGIFLLLFAGQSLVHLTQTGNIWVYPFNLIWVAPLGFILGFILTPDTDRDVLSFGLIGGVATMILFVYIASTGALNP